jgi:hypothetical protein
MLELHQGTLSVTKYLSVALLDLPHKAFTNQRLVTWVTKSHHHCPCVHCGASPHEVGGLIIPHTPIWRCSPRMRVITWRATTPLPEGCHWDIKYSRPLRYMGLIDHSLKVLKLEGLNLTRISYSVHPSLGCDLECLEMSWMWSWISWDGGWSAEALALTYLSLGAH